MTTTVEAALSGVTSADTWSGIAGSDNSSGGGQGVFGVSQHGIGVWGVNPDPSGLLGTDVAGVVGDSNSSFGVLGLSSSSAGVLGKSSGAHQSGVGGYDTSTGGGWGVYASSDHGTGLGAVSASGLDIEAAGTVGFRQEAQATAGAPTQSDVSYFAGEQVRDTLGAMYLCIESGSPGTWVRVARPPAYASGPLPAAHSDPRCSTPGRTPPPPITRGYRRPVRADHRAHHRSIGGGVPISGRGRGGHRQRHGRQRRSPRLPDAAGRRGHPARDLLDHLPATTSVANGVTVALSALGRMDIYASQTTDVIFDATGFIA